MYMQAAKKPKCGLLSFLQELEALSSACERIFAGSGRRADVERWYVALAGAMLQAVAGAAHPRTPRAVLHLENYHRLHAVLSALRLPALEALRRECRARYSDALRAYVTQYFGRPLEKLTQFFEGVSEAVAQGVREDEVCYRAAFSKHELRRVLAMYPAHEVRKSLHRLYRTVEKHLSEEGGLLQVVWRAMQEEFIAQHVALQARIAACYPAAGLTLPLTTQHILDAFSDIAREH
ncbi:exocyst complex component 1 isoform X1 [Spodoptera litura]|uniref:Exocyst complex component 1 isoform X1 n=1 Tax=Spodoptera litura TaxID=69820 RepID=A0A9J7EGU0_SPOLT|nr:exocyst complex component 1 isoform X1 [Spodoptera litura]